jgi:uncharacterized protein YjiK
MGGWVKPAGNARFGATSHKKDAGPAEFKLGGSTKVGVKEASDVVALPGGKFLVVGDRSDSAAIVDDEGKSSRLKLDGVKSHQSGLEGVAYDPSRNHLFVMSEETGKLLRYEWNPSKNDSPKLEKEFEIDLGGSKNKGVEGLAYLPGDNSPTGKPQLLLVKEGDPKTLAMVDDGGGGKAKEIDLEKQIKDVCKDFSAVAVDPKSGHVFISSDEAGLVAEIKLVKKGDQVKAELVQSFPLRDDKGKSLDRVEGLTFDEKGNLFVLLENERELVKLSRK